jgi:hypothetical protein
MTIDYKDDLPRLPTNYTQEYAWRIKSTGRYIRHKFIKPPEREFKRTQMEIAKQKITKLHRPDIIVAVETIQLTTIIPTTNRYDATSYKSKVFRINTANNNLHSLDRMTSVYQLNMSMQ